MNSGVLTRKNQSAEVAMKPAKRPVSNAKKIAICVTPLVVVNPLRGLWLTMRDIRSRLVLYSECVRVRPPCVRTVYAHVYALEKGIK